MAPAPTSAASQPAVPRGSLLGAQRAWNGPITTLPSGTSSDPAGGRVACVQRLTLDAAGKEAAIRQSRAASSAGNKLLVEVYDLAELTTGLYLVYEQAEGKTLRQLMREGPMAAHAADFILRIIAAAEFAQGCGVAYRTLMPEDVLVGADGQARLMPAALSAMRDPNASRFYAAPAWQGAPSNSSQASVFSLGVCLYELLTGRLPFAAPDDVLQMKCTVPSKAVAGLPPALDAVFLRALQPDPALRFKTLAELRDALTSAVRPAGPLPSQR